MRLLWHIRDATCQIGTDSRLQAPAQIENWSALTAAVAEGGLLTRNRIEVEGVKSQKIDMLVAAHTEFGDASQNTVVVKDSDIYLCQERNSRRRGYIVNAIDCQ